MLKNRRSHTTLPAADLERAKAFWIDKVGMELAGEGPGGAVVKAADGSRFVLYPTPNTERGGHTQIGFSVDDVEAEVADLKGRGVEFEEYDFPGLKTVNAVADTGEDRAAWFKDSEGNTVGLIQLKDQSLL